MAFRDPIAQVGTFRTKNTSSIFIILLACFDDFHPLRSFCASLGVRCLRSGFFWLVLRRTWMYRKLWEISARIKDIRSIIGGACEIKWYSYMMSGNLSLSGRIIWEFVRGATVQTRPPRSRYPSSHSSHFCSSEWLASQRRAFRNYPMITTSQKHILYIDGSHDMIHLPRAE